LRLFVKHSGGDNRLIHDEFLALLADPELDPIFLTSINAVVMPVLTESDDAKDDGGDDGDDEGDSDGDAPPTPEDVNAEDFLISFA